MQQQVQKHKLNPADYIGSLVGIRPCRQGHVCLIKGILTAVSGNTYTIKTEKGIVRITQENKCGDIFFPPSCFDEKGNLREQFKIWLRGAEEFDDRYLIFLYVTGLSEEDYKKAQDSGLTEEQLQEARSVWIK